MIFFLGLDGLDHLLVEKHDCQALMQKAHGTLEVPINPYRGYPLSPEVWACFLTGKQVGHLEFVMNQKVRGGLTLFKMFSFLRRFMPLKLGLGKKVVDNPSHYPELHESTFLDLPNKNIFAYNAPFYNYDHAVFKLNKQWGTGKLSNDEYETAVLRLFQTRKKQLINHSVWCKDRDVCFVYIEFPDAVQHKMHMHPQLLAAHYAELDGFVEKYTTLIPKCTFIILSDHGFDFEKGNHSNLGFWSCNTVLNDAPERITDFYPLVSGRRLCECGKPLEKGELLCSECSFRKQLEMT